MNSSNLLVIPFSMIVAGPSGCGKSTFVEQLFRYFIVKRAFKNIYWYNCDPRAISKEIKNLSIVEIHELSISFDHIEDDSLIILDDLMLEAFNKSICGLFIRKSHHHNISVILTSQNVNFNLNIQQIFH